MDQRPLVVSKEQDGDVNMRFPHGVLDLENLSQALYELKKEEKRARKREGLPTSSGEASRPTTPDPGAGSSGVQ